MNMQASQQNVQTLTQQNQNTPVAQTQTASNTTQTNNTTTYRSQEYRY